MNEEKFLQNREVREQQKKSRDGPSEDTLAWETFRKDMESHHEKIEALLKEAASAGTTLPDGGEQNPSISKDDGLLKCTEAHQSWLGMQDTIRTAAEICANLPPHELRSANSLLYHLFTKIDTQKSDLKGSSKKFRFSSKVKLCQKTQTMIKEQAAAEESIQAALAGTSSALDRHEGDDIISKRENETLFIGSKKAVFLRGCKNCTFLVLPTNGSLFMDNCTDCRLYCASHQLRMKSCHRVNVYVCCRSTPIIEACRDMRFGSYTAWSGLLASKFKDSEGREHQYSSVEEWVEKIGNIKNYANHGVKSFEHIDDFDWLRQQHSPHWSTIPQCEYEVDSRKFEQQ